MAMVNGSAGIAYFSLHVVWHTHLTPATAVHSIPRIRQYCIDVAGAHAAGCLPHQELFTALLKVARECNFRMGHRPLYRSKNCATIVLTPPIELGAIRRMCSRLCLA